MISGKMIGAGAYSTGGLVAVELGGGLPAILIWILGGLISASGAFAYVELGTMFPQSGGEQTYLRNIYRHPPELLAFLFSFCLIAVTEVAGFAAIGTVLGKYVALAFVGPLSATASAAASMQRAWLERGIGTICVLVIMMINIVSIRWSVRINSILTVIKTTALLVIALSGLVILTGVTKIPRQMSNWTSGFTQASSNPRDYASALFKVLFTYTGWSNLNYSLGEVKNPRRNLPIAIIGGVGSVALLYTLVNVAYLTVVPMVAIRGAKEAIAGEYSSIVFGSIVGRKIMPICIALSCFGSLSAGFFGVSRIVVAASEAGYMPFSHIFKRISPRFGTPVNAVILNAVMTLLYMLAPPPGHAFGFLIDTSSYPMWVFCGITALGVLIMRYREPSRARPFKTWMPSVVLFVIATIFLSVFPFVPDPRELAAGGIPFFLAPLVGILFILGGIPLYYFTFYKALKSQ
ncbi:amino acid transporter [Ramicandelaber brevisporus]|nr:amino acid transporter [Ramicandelaber brevisporus]